MVGSCPSPYNESLLTSTQKKLNTIRPFEQHTCNLTRNNKRDLLRLLLLLWLPAPVGIANQLAKRKCYTACLFACVAATDLLTRRAALLATCITPSLCGCLSACKKTYSTYCCCCYFLFQLQLLICRVS